MPINPSKCRQIISNGNLPSYKANDNTCEVNMSLITMPCVTVKNFTEYSLICPFHTAPADDDNAHVVRNTNPFSSNYWNFEVAIPPAQRANHVATNGRMVRWKSGSKYGWLCVDDACPYHNGITVEYNGETIVVSSPGQRYFYI